MKINIAAILLGLSLVTPLAFADVPLKSKDEVLGAWKLDHTKKNADSQEINKREDSWDLFDVFGAIKLFLLDLGPSCLEDKPS